MRSLLLVPLVALSACLPHPPPAPPPGEVIPQTTDVTLSRLPAGAIAAYQGSYRGAVGTITIRRVGDALIAERGAPSGATTLKVVGLGTFVDAAGTTYLFVPADGSGGRLRTVDATGASLDWRR